MKIVIGNIKAKANPILSTFVMICAIVAVGLLYVMEKAQATGIVIVTRNGVYTEYLND